MSNPGEVPQIFRPFQVAEMESEDYRSGVKCAAKRQGDSQAPTWDISWRPYAWPKALLWFYFLRDPSRLDTKGAWKTAAENRVAANESRFPWSDPIRELAALSDKR